MYKKSVIHVQSCCFIKPIVFLTFSSPSASLDLTVPNIEPDSPFGWAEVLRKMNCGRKNAAVMSATAKFISRKFIEVLVKISEINAISRRKIKTS